MPNEDSMQDARSSINGQTVIAALIREPGHRCDQWRAEIDGAIVADAMGLVDLCVLLRGRFGKAPSRRMLAAFHEEKAKGYERTLAHTGAALAAPPSIAPMPANSAFFPPGTCASISASATP